MIKKNMKKKRRPQRKIYRYTILGIPIALAKVTDNTATVWDAYKQDRFHYIQTIKNQHDTYYKGASFAEGATEHREFVDGPIKLEAIFYMKTTPRRKAGEQHSTSPPTFSLFNFLDHALQGVVYKYDTVISAVKLNKIYDNRPRTEITITRLA